LRPVRSAIGPQSMAPTMIPTLESANAWVEAAGGSPQALISAGAAKPIAERSYPSNIWIRAHSTATRICSELNAALSGAPTPTFCAGAMIRFPLSTAVAG
jgi:hypothetical protein